MGQSRNEEILESMIAGTEYTKVPQSREEYLLMQLAGIVSALSANFIGTFQSVAALEAYTGPKDKNDFAFVETQDTYSNKFYDKYTWNDTAWVFEYKVNNNSFTDPQWSAINSGITSDDIPVVLSESAFDALVTKTAKLYCIYPDPEVTP